MKLRDHPLLRQWPPIWTSLNNEDERISRSDEGVLTEVRESMSRSDGIVLIMHHNNNRYGSILLFLTSGVSRANIRAAERLCGP